MDKILYFGNKLSNHGSNPTAIEWLAPEIEKIYNIITSSSKKNIVVRMADMIFTFIKHGKQTNIILIDTYSTLAFIYFIIIVLLSKIYNIQYIPILRGGNLQSQLDKYPKLSKYLFGYSYINVSPSLYLEKVFSEYGFHVEYIPNFIHINNYPFKKRAHYSPKLLWVRSMHTIYNPTMAIRVLYELKKTYNDVELCMVGPFKDKSAQETIKIAKDLSISESIKLTGKLLKSEWIDLSKQYDIFINTTNYDNHPMSVIEAMALGLPVVSTNAGGMIHLINDGENGLLVDKADIKGMVEKIKLIINGKIDAQLICDNARSQVEYFDSIIIMKKWSDLLNSISKN